VKKDEVFRPESTVPLVRRRSRPTLQYSIIFIACVLGANALVGEKGLLAMIQARQQYRALQESLAGARLENARLREEARQLREVPAVIEEYARRELGLIRPGEKLFIIRTVSSSDPRSMPR
jgi:cell division protein FtsB